jgi:tol-pal system protein YbgF
MTVPFSTRRMAGAFATLVATLLLASTAMAQDLNSEVRRLREDLNALQRQVYRGGPPPAGAPVGVPQGNSDISGDIANRLSDRISQIESQIQQLTGRTEEIDYRTTQMQRRLDKLVEDIDFRLSALEKGGTTAPPAPPSPPPGQQGTAPPPPPAQAAAPASRTSDPNTPAAPSGLLGTLRTGPGGQVTGGSQAPGANVPTPPPAPRTASLQGANAKERYDYAYSLLLKSQYPEAEAALGEFLRLHGDDPLAGNAQYWLGESYYARKEYEKAAQAFLAGYQKYPKNAKAPDSLLKLGKTLNDLNQKQEACTVFAQFAKDYPAASATQKGIANTERARANCR